jgi:hypothetical protein
VVRNRHAGGDELVPAPTSGEGAVAKAASAAESAALE